MLPIGGNICEADTSPQYILPLLLNYSIELRFTTLALVLLASLYLPANDGNGARKGKSELEEFECPGGNTVKRNGMVLNWRIEGANILLEMSSPRNGWLAIGFNRRSGLQGTHLLMGRVINGTAEVSDRFIVAPGNHQTIASLGGKPWSDEISGWEIGSGTVIRFRLPLYQADKWRYALAPGNQYYVLMAFSQEDYIGMAKAGKIGGSKRELHILSLDIQNEIARAKVVLQNETTRFNSYFSMVRKATGNWQMIAERKRSLRNEETVSVLGESWLVKPSSQYRVLLNLSNGSNRACKGLRPER